jgi:3'-phosphoadenosine 5'-phosphosulfate sulfotransferase (PAPS reductase)/FAD synthetase
MVIYHLEKTRTDIKILVVSGERRGESVGRSKYNEMELHRKHAVSRARRTVHQWRAVIDYSLRDVWELLRRHNITPHPCYTCGWGRCSCMCCIFSLPCHWAGIRELFPTIYDAFRQDETNLGFTLDNKKTLDEYVGDAKSCVSRGDEKALEQLITGRFHRTDIVFQGEWRFPKGAFKGTSGGPC